MRNTETTTENDTFLVLSRISKREVVDLLNSEFYPVHRGSDYVEYILAKEKFLNKHKWTLYEFNKFNK